MICQNGHLYDENMYAQCPICSGWQPVPPPKKKKSKLKIILLVAIVLVLAAAAAVSCIFIFGKEKYVINAKKSVPKDIEIAAGQQTFVSPDETFSFLYPSTAETEWDDKSSSAYVYTVESGEIPYILVYYSKENNVAPGKYFKDYKKVVNKTYDDPKFDEVSKTKIGDKTLYMLRCEIKEKGSTYTIDRYIEIYDDCSVQYTIKSNHASSEDKVFSDLVSSLYLDADAYKNSGAAGYSDTAVASNSTVGISMSVPTGVQAQEIPVGLLAQSDDMMLFASYQNSDAQGAAIYDADDFVERITSVDGLLQNQLGADQVTLNNGSVVQLGNYQAYEFPLEITVSSFTGTGKLYLLNGSNAGCYILYYAVTNENTLSQIAQQCISSFSIDSLPQNTPQYNKFTESKNAFSFMYRSDVTQVEAQDTGDSAAIILSDDDVLMVYTSSQTVEGVSSAEQCLKQFGEDLKKQNPDISYSITEPKDSDGGRFGFKTIEIKYTIDKTPRTVSLSAADGANGAIHIVYYTSSDKNVDTLSTLRDDIIWSFKAN